MTKTKAKAGKDTICQYCRRFRTCHIHGRRYLCDECGYAHDGTAPPPSPAP